jgi:hypothetical protein
MYPTKQATYHSTSQKDPNLKTGQTYESCTTYNYVYVPYDTIHFFKRDRFENHR